MAGLRTKRSRTTRHIEILGPNDLGYVLDLGKGYKAKIVSGRGYVIGNSKKVENADSPNEMSIAVLVSGPGAFDFLVTGDLIGVPNGSKENLDLEVLRTGHHGADNATSESFIDKLKPEVALISVGGKLQQRKSFQHPRCKTLTNLKSVELVIQTGAGNHDYRGQPPIESVVANGTVLIEVKEDKYTVQSLPNTSSLDLQTNEFYKYCTVGDGCSK